MCSTYEVTSALRPARRRDSLLADELGATLDYNTEIARYDLLLQARLRPPTLSRTRLLHGRAGHRPPSADARLPPARAGTSRRREVRARPDQRAGSAPAASPCGRARRLTRTRWIVMPSSTSSPSQVLTNASPPPGRIAGRIPRPSKAVSKTASTPPGTAWRTAVARPSPRGSTTSAAKAAHELLVGRACIGEDDETRPLRERDHVRREQARSAGDEQRCHLQGGRAARDRATP